MANHHLVHTRKSQSIAQKIDQSQSLAVTDLSILLRFYPIRERRICVGSRPNEYIDQPIDERHEGNRPAEEESLLCGRSDGFLGFLLTYMAEGMSGSIIRAWNRAFLYIPSLSMAADAVWVFNANQRVRERRHRSEFVQVLSILVCCENQLGKG